MKHLAFWNEDFALLELDILRLLDFWFTAFVVYLDLFLYANFMHGLDMVEVLIMLWGEDGCRMRQFFVTLLRMFLK